MTFDSSYNPVFYDSITMKIFKPDSPSSENNDLYKTICILSLVQLTSRKGSCNICFCGQTGSFGHLFCELFRAYSAALVGSILRGLFASRLVDTSVLPNRCSCWAPEMFTVLADSGNELVLLRKLWVEQAYPGRHIVPTNNYRFKLRLSVLQRKVVA